MENKEINNLGNSWSGMLTDDTNKADILLKSIPFDNATSFGKGAAEGPDRMRQLSEILPPYDETGIKLEDFYIQDRGNHPNDLNWERYFNDIEQDAFEMMSTGKFCLFLGGDHSCSIPLTNAFGKVYGGGEKNGYIHFDSHGDLCYSFQGSKWSHACPARRASEQIPNLSDEGMTFIGIRSFEEEEMIFYSEHAKVKVIRADEVFANGVDYVIETLMERYEGFDNIYLSIDIDVLDPAFAPGTGTPECGGLSTRELMKIIKTIITALPIKAMDLVEVSPVLDSSNITSWAALKLLYSIFGQKYLEKIKV